MDRIWNVSRRVSVAAGLVLVLGGSAASAAEPSRDELAEQVRQLRSEVAELKAGQDQQQRQQQDTAARVDKALVERTVNDVLADAKKRGTLLPSTKDKWYEKLSIRGYTQLRYYPVISGGSEGPELSVPNDRAVDEDNQSFIIRRGRIVLSGDVSEHLYLYAQVDLAGGVGSGLDLAVQTRDLYGDIAIDAEKEHRFRVGQSKVPFGWVNLQSSSNRAPLERPDAINSAVEGERDIGVFYMWASAEARKRYKELVSSGLKGSGDYGVIAFGAYSGNGLNRNDNNGEPHWVARAAYPFKLDNGQFFEVGVQAYTGRFLSPTGPAEIVDGQPFTPVVHNRGVRDQRVGATFVYYPQPFGIEAEYMIGRGPQLDVDDQEIDDQFLHGGYVQLNYRYEDANGVWFPFVRYHYYEGGRKFARNAPGEIVQELDVGLEWSPWPEVELTAMYTRTLDRTNTSSAPYEQATGDRFGLQLQLNY